MNIRPRDEKDGRMLRKKVRARRRRHDPMLVLNLATFNFIGGWRRTFSKNEYARSYA
jgi:hypothetical protein